MRINTLTCKDVLKKAFFAQFCLFGYFFGSIVRYNEAVDFVRAFMEEHRANFDDNSDDADLDGDGSSCEGSGGTVTSSTTDGGGPPEDEDPSVNSEPEGVDPDLDCCVQYAVPGVAEYVEDPAWLGTRGRKKGQRVSFARNYSSKCPESKVVNYKLIDGSFGGRK